MWGIALLSSCVGLLIVMMSFQLNKDLKQMVFESDDFFSQNYLTINKKVFALDSFKMKTNAFNQQEIEEVRSLDSVQGVGVFEASRFRAHAEVGGKMFPNYRTEIFFESIADEFLDIQSVEWYWDEKKPFLPLIIPADFIHLYNFGFAPSRGLPQMAPSLLSQIPFRLKLSGDKGDVHYLGKIVGFSDRINSILVPGDFMSWANENYGVKQDEAHFARLMVLTSNPPAPEFIEFLNDKNYQANEEKMKGSKFQSLSRALSGLSGIIGGVILFMALMIFLLNFQLLINRSYEKIERLIERGFMFWQIMKVYIVALVGCVFLIMFVSFPSLYFAKVMLGYEFHSYGLDLSKGVSVETLLVGICFCLLFLILNMANIALSIKRIGR
tara:strand:- start:163 stop:1311 length:1149 start_codon:yes stop_codon:yes gene_type:complete